MSKYIGERLSLVTKSQIRYVGILVSADPESSTLTLSQVHVLGTEDRRPLATKIAPSKEVFAEVSFSSQDIVDIKVYETPKQPAQPTLPVDSAIIAAKSSTANAPNTPASTKTQPPQPAKPFSVSTGKDTPAVPKPAPTFASSAKSQPASSATRTVVSYSTGTGQRQVVERDLQATLRTYASAVGFNHDQGQVRRQPGSFPSRPHQAHNQQRSSVPLTIPKTEFDFTLANARFSKDDLAAEADDQPHTYYNKASSFFDDISCETRDGRSLAREDRRVNMETFGQTSLGPSSFRRGSGSTFGRGRGGTSSRGDGRGSYQRRGQGGSFNRGTSMSSSHS